MSLASNLLTLSVRPFSNDINPVPSRSFLGGQASLRVMPVLLARPIKAPPLACGDPPFQDRKVPVLLGFSGFFGLCQNLPERAQIMLEKSAMLLRVGGNL